MAAPRQRMQPYPCLIAFICQYLPIGLRRAAIKVIHMLARAVWPIGAQRQINTALFQRQKPPQPCVIRLLRAPLFELLSQKPLRRLGPCKDHDGTILRSDEPIADLGPIIETYRPAAVLVNCSVPEAMAAALAEVAKFGLPYGAYANGFTHISGNFLKDAATVAELTHRHDLTPDKYAEFAMGWVAQGATIVGGCCDVGPAHIRALHNALIAAGHQIA